MNPQRPPDQQPRQQEHIAGNCGNTEASSTLVRRRHKSASARVSLRLTLRTALPGSTQASRQGAACRLTPWTISRQSTQDSARQQSTATFSSEVSSAASASSSPSANSVPAVSAAENTTKQLPHLPRWPETFGYNESFPQSCEQPEGPETLSGPVTSSAEAGRGTASTPLEIYTPAHLHSELFCCAAQAGAAAEAAETVANPPELLTPRRTVRRHFNLLQQINLQIEALHGILHLYKDLELETFAGGNSNSTGNGSNAICSNGACDDNNGSSGNSENDSSANGHHTIRRTSKLWPFLLLLQEQMHLSYETLLQTTNLLPSLLYEALCRHCGAEQTVKAERSQHQQQTKEGQQQLQHQGVSQHLPAQGHSPAALKTRSSRRLAFLAEKKAAEAGAVTVGPSKTTALASTSGTAIAKTSVSRPSTAATGAAARSVAAPPPLSLSQRQHLLLHLELNKQHEGVLKALCSVLDSHLEQTQSTELEPPQQHYQ